MRAWLRITFAKRIAFFALAAASSLAPTFASAVEQIPWVGGVKQAQQIAGARGRLVLLHFRGNNCPPCDRMDKEIFTQASVARAIAINYVPVKINVDESPELKTHYKVSQWPTEIVLAPDGSEVRRWVGAPKSADSYVAHLDGVSANFRVYQGGASTEIAAAKASEADASAAPYRQVQYSQQYGQQYGQQYKQQASQEAARPAGDDRYSNLGPAQSAATDYQHAAPAYGQNRWRQSEPAAGEVQPTGAYSADRADAANRYAPPADYSSRQSQFMPRNASGGEMNGYAEAGASTTEPSGRAGAAEPQPQQEQLNPYSRGDVRVAQAPVQNNVSNGYPSGPSQRDAYQPSTFQPSESQPSPYQPSPSTPNPYHSSQPQAGSYQSNPYQASAPPTGAAVQGSPPSGPTPSQAVGVAPPPMAMDGFCPVTLCERQEWTKGDRRYGAIHRGRTYLFTTQEAQTKFLQNPDRYSPVLSGCDVVRFIEGGEFVDGLRKYGIFVGEHVFLFADEASLDAFEKNPRHYAQAAWRAMQDGGATLR